MDARINQREVVILVDSGSTHNFIDHKLTMMLHLHVKPLDQLKIMIAIGGSMVTQGVYKEVKWESQDH